MLYGCFLTLTSVWEKMEEEDDLSFDYIHILIFIYLFFLLMGKVTACPCDKKLIYLPSRFSPLSPGGTFMVQNMSITSPSRPLRVSPIVPGYVMGSGLFPAKKRGCYEITSGC